jgi:hypothetical protein
MVSALSLFPRRAIRCWSCILERPLCLAARLCIPCRYVIVMTQIELFHCTEIGDGSSRRPWHLEEISERGARLRVELPDNVPDRFTLLLKGHVVRIHKCHVVWRSASHIGVEFAAAASGDDQDCA